MTKNELITARSALSLTQHDMAAVLGVNIRTYQGWESGRNIPDVAETAVEMLRFMPEDVRRRWVDLKLK